MIQRELPIKIDFGNGPRPKNFRQHIKRIRLTGPPDDFPEEIVLNADEISEGGVLTIDDLNLPQDFDVVDRRANEPVVAVQRERKLERGRRNGFDE